MKNIVLSATLVRVVARAKRAGGKISKSFLACLCVLAGTQEGFANQVVPLPVTGFNFVTCQIMPTGGSASDINSAIFNSTAFVVVPASLSDPNGNDNVVLYNWNCSGYDTYQYFTAADAVSYFGSGGGSGWYTSAGALAAGVYWTWGKGMIIERKAGTSGSLTLIGPSPSIPQPPATNICSCGILNLLGLQGTGAGTYDTITGSSPVDESQVFRWNGATFDFYSYTVSGGWSPPLAPLNSGEAAFFLVPCPCPQCPNATSAPTPPNDLCVNAAPLSAGLTYGYTFNATPSPAGTLTPSPCGQSVNSPDVWYTFTTNCPGGTVTLDTCQNPCGSSNHFDTVLSVYTGTCPLLSQIACNNNNNACTNSPLSSRVTFTAAPCVTYYVRVAGYQGATGCFALNATFQPATLPVPANDLCGPNVPLIKCNETKSFQTCAATTGGPVTSGCTFQKDTWFRYIPACTGMVSVATCGSFFDTVLAVYHGPCTNLILDACNNDAIAGPCAGSLQSYLTFQVTNPNTTYYIRVGSSNGTACTGKLTVIGPNPPLNTCPPTNCAVKQQRVFQLVGTATGNGWGWCLSSPCCFNISGVVPAGTVSASAPASALVAAMVNSINAVCPNTAVQLTGSSNNKFKIKVCSCATCPTPFVFRVGSTNTACDDMCVVNSPLIVATTGACVFNPGISEVPLSEQDCNHNGEDDTLDILNGTSQDNDENGVPDECPIRLNIASETLGNEVVISWIAIDAILEQSSGISGPWSEVVGATSPYVIAPATGREFFRLRVP